MSAREWQRPGDCLVCAYGAPDGAPAARRGGYLGSPGRAGEGTVTTHEVEILILKAAENPANIISGVAKKPAGLKRCQGAAEDGRLTI